VFDKFMEMEPEKRERIVQAATKEFALKGYKNASTNEIVKEAKISKGLIFHYFNNKKQLYLHLYDYLTEVIVTEYLGKLKNDEPDFLKKMGQAALVKLELFRKHPMIFKFFLTAYVETDPEVREEVAGRNQKMVETNYPKIYEGVDYSNIREDIDKEKAVSMIIWALEGYANSKSGVFRNMTEKEFGDMIVEISSYMDILKKCFYKSN